MRMNQLLKGISKTPDLPILRRTSPAVDLIASEDTLEGFLHAQRTATKAVKEVAGFIQEGWTEKQTADLINTYLKDLGVESFFHRAFVWFGDRTKFEGVSKYKGYLPTNRRVLPGDVYILDVAPIVDGFCCDIGYTNSLGPNEKCDEARLFLKELRSEILELFSGIYSGGEIWQSVEASIHAAGYENVHKEYPFSVLGHRIYNTKEYGGIFSFMNFGWQSYWSILSRGMIGQLLTSYFEGNLTGLWAIEPHLGAQEFGAKFEEILVVQEGSVRWLEGESTLV